MTIDDLYRTRFAQSAELFAEARTRFPGGITHDGRHALPFPLYVQRAQGAWKWDVDDNRMIDYWCGHGALLLGHGHPGTVAAVQRQAGLGTHFGSGHRLELDWAALVQQLIPGAERLRFTASGTEASMLALRLARAATRKPAIIRFAGHFHGWHDGIAAGADPGDPHAGLTSDMMERVLVLPPDIDIVADTLARRDDIAAVILEPTGASYGIVPLPATFLRDLRALTVERDVLLICDEVVTGFRVSPGGAQARAGIAADLTCLAKILAGGLPGGAVAGREDLLRRLAFGDAEWNANEKIRHQGTYNANPLSAAAGVAVLREIATGEPVERAAEMGRRLCAAFNAVLRARRLRGWTAYGDGSIVHLFVDPALALAPGELPLQADLAAIKRGGDARIQGALRKALQIHGVDLMRGRSAFVSAAHTAADIDASAEALDAAIDLLLADEFIS
jgi:glutamate-1-semialdehyde 2,1-aminomutase